MTAVWPSELPQRANRQGFDYSFGDGRKFTRPEAGPLRVRRRFSSAAKPISAAFSLTWQQLRRLEVFWEADTGGGSLPFWFPDQIKGGVPIATADGRPLCTASGAPLVTAAWCLVLFGETPPKPSPLGGENWMVALQLWVMP